MCGPLPFDTPVMYILVLVLFTTAVLQVRYKNIYMCVCVQYVINVLI